jgi:hypothetical protein
MFLIVLICVLLLSPLPSRADIATGLVAYWPLNTDGSDASGNGHGGILGGGPAFLSGASCKVGGCIVCDGIDDVISFTTITTGTTFTITAWVYNQLAAGIYGSILVDAPGDNGVFIRDGRFDLYYSGTDHYNTTAFANDTWVHIAMVVNAGAVQLYLNGVADGTYSGATGFSVQNACNNAATNLDMVGRIDELRLYSRALSQADVQEAMNFTGVAPSVTGRRRPLIY